MSNIIFLIPAFNEEKNLKMVIFQFKKHGAILVVNDGSTDDTEKIAKKYSNYYIKNFSNKGLIILSKKDCDIFLKILIVLSML